MHPDMVRSTPILLLVPFVMAVADPGFDPSKVWFQQDGQGHWMSNIPIRERVPLGRPVSNVKGAPLDFQVLEQDGRTVSRTVTVDDYLSYDRKGLSPEEISYVVREHLIRQDGGGRTYRTTRNTATGETVTLYSIDPIAKREFERWRGQGAPGDRFVLDTDATRRPRGGARTPPPERSAATEAAMRRMRFSDSERIVGAGRVEDIRARDERRLEASRRARERLRGKGATEPASRER